jgi:hypothetical protein
MTPAPPVVIPSNAISNVTTSVNGSCPAGYSDVPAGPNDPSGQIMMTGYSTYGGRSPAIKICVETYQLGQPNVVSDVQIAARNAACPATYTQTGILTSSFTADQQNICVQYQPAAAAKMIVTKFYASGAQSCASGETSSGIYEIQFPATNLVNGRSGLGTLYCEAH